MNTDKLSNFEYELLWMSSRYAIGRHTIASCMLPQHIIQEMYGRLSDEQMQSQCIDIRNEVYDKLNVWYNFEMNDYSMHCMMDPLSLFMECIETQNIVDLNNTVKAFGFDSSNNAFFEKIKGEDDKRRFVAPLHYLTDLAPWASLANLFNKENWLKVTVKTPEGKEEVIPVYSAWIDDFRNEIPIRMVYKSLDDVCSMSYLNPDFIVNIEPYEAK